MAPDGLRTRCAVFPANHTGVVCHLVQQSAGGCVSRCVLLIIPEEGTFMLSSSRARFAVAIPLVIPAIASAQVQFDPFVNYSTGDSPWSLTAADVDQDGFDDIITAGWTFGEAVVHYNDQMGGFSTSISYNIGETTAGGIVAIDLNNDSYPDIATSNLDWNTASVLINNQDGTFGAPTTYPVGDRSWNVDAGDLNNDNFADIVTANVLTNDVSVLLNNQDGTFSAATHYVAEQSCIDITIGDLNGDGWNDIGVANFSFSTMAVLMNNQDGTFAPSVSYSAGAGSRGIHAVDLDRDNDLDLVTADSLDGNVTIRLNDGSGGFNTRRNVAVGNWPYQVEPLDVNNDGDPDLAVVDSCDNGVYILRNLGNGRFADPVFVQTQTGVTTTDVVVGDWDDSGTADVAVSNLSSASMDVVLNQTADPPVLTQTVFVRGSNATMTVTGALSGEIVFFLYGTNGVGPGTCAPQLGGLCLDLNGPIQIVGQAVADDTGTASLTARVPINAPPIMLWTQAAIQRGVNGDDSVRSNSNEATIM